MILEVFFNLNNTWFYNSVSSALFSLPALSLAIAQWPRTYDWIPAVFLGMWETLSAKQQEEGWGWIKREEVPQSWKNTRRKGWITAVPLFCIGRHLCLENGDNRKPEFKRRYPGSKEEKGLLPWCKCEDDVIEEASATIILNLWITRIKSGYDLREETL